MKASPPYAALTLSGTSCRASAASAREDALPLVHVLGPALVDEAVLVAEEDVPARHAQLDVLLRARDRRRAGAHEDDLHCGRLLARQLQRVDERSAGDDGGAVLIVVE